MGFPRNSAWDQHPLTRGHHESDREFQERIVDTSTRHEAQVRTAAVHISTLEQWVMEIEMAIDNLKPGDSYVELELENVMDSIRSHYPG